MTDATSAATASPQAHGQTGEVQYRLSAESILCFGDSNTWGAIPGSDFGRYGPDIRWPRVMADKLGDRFDVYEAGLNGRTTAFDWPPQSYRSGRDLIAPTLETCAPVDIVVILLGTNDVAMPHLSVSDIARGAGELITIVRSSTDFGPRPGQAPTPLLVGPHIVGPLDAQDEQASPDASERSAQLVDAYRELAARLRCSFVDLSRVVSPSERDPWHWDPPGHEHAAETLAAAVRQLSN